MNNHNDSKAHLHETSRAAPASVNAEAGKTSGGVQIHPKHANLSPIQGRLTSMAQIGEDWLYLALLGIIMALLSFSMDSIITLFLNTRFWFSNEMRNYNLIVQYVAWCATPILLVTFSTGFVHLCSPTVSRRLLDMRVF